MAWFVLKSVPCISSPEEAVEYLQIDCSDETLSEQLRSRSSREKYSSRDRRMAYSRCSLSGMMSRLLDPIIRIRESISRGSDPSEITSASQEDSHARTSRSPEREPDWKVRARGYGLRCSGSLAKWDRGTSSWRTAQCLLFEDSTELLETLPSWGMTRAGELSALMMQERPTRERGSGSGERWPTPTAHDAKGKCVTVIRKDGKSRLDQLATKVTFPTPGTTGFSNETGNVNKANDLFERGVLTEEERRSFRAGNGGQLNPDWVEALMFWPKKWTSLEPMKKESYEGWEKKAIRGELWTVDPANLPPTDTGYIPRVTDEKCHRRERLMTLGNGQVPSCVCLAETILGGTA